MRRRLRNRPYASTPIRPRHLFQNDTFLWAGGILLVTSVAFSVTTVYSMWQGQLESSAMWRGLIVAGALGTVMQLTNLWRGRLFNLFLLLLFGERTSHASNADGAPAEESGDFDLLREIPHSCDGKRERKGDVVGVCHHCGRFVCKKCGLDWEDFRFVDPEKRNWRGKRKRESAWHCARCLRQYHAKEIGWQLARPSWAIKRPQSS